MKVPSKQQAILEFAGGGASDGAEASRFRVPIPSATLGQKGTAAPNSAAPAASRAQDRGLFLLDAGARVGTAARKWNRTLPPIPQRTLAADHPACSTSPGQPEPQVLILFVRLVVVAIRRTRVPSIIVEGAAPPHVMTAFRFPAYQDWPASECSSAQKIFPRGGLPPRLPRAAFHPPSKGKGKKIKGFPRPAGTPGPDCVRPAG